MSAAKMRKGADEQLGAYLSMLNANYPNVMVDKCVTVISGPKVCTVLSAEPDECFKKWEAALERYRASQDLMGF
jgi:hypothetical protein